MRGELKIGYLVVFVGLILAACSNTQLPANPGEADQTPSDVFDKHYKLMRLAIKKCNIGRISVLLRTHYIILNEYRESNTHFGYTIGQKNQGHFCPEAAILLLQAGADPDFIVDFKYRGQDWHVAINWRELGQAHSYITQPSEWRKIHQVWRKAVDIAGTPTFLVQSGNFPQPYWRRNIFQVIGCAQGKDAGVREFIDMLLRGGNAQKIRPLLRQRQGVLQETPIEYMRHYSCPKTADLMERF